MCTPVTAVPFDYCSTLAAWLLCLLIVSVGADLAPAPSRHAPTAPWIPFFPAVRAPSLRTTVKTIVLHYPDVLGAHSASPPRPYASAYV